MAGNWKMFKSPAETTAFFEKFLPLVAGSHHAEVVICAPFIDLAAAIAATQGSAVSIGGQNLHWAKEGAFTGEISGPMLRAIGCQYVIVGHSERRQFFGETDETVMKRTIAALEVGLTPIVCVGEMLAEREANRTNEVLKTQFDGGVAGLTEDQFSRIVIAYEPVWAIGTGKVATPDIAADAHRALRGYCESRFGREASQAVRILYGGSVKPDNVQGLMAQPEIDGGLVGGASLEAGSFAGVVNF